MHGGFTFIYLTPTATPVSSAKEIFVIKLTNIDHRLSKKEGKAFFIYKLKNNIFLISIF